MNNQINITKFQTVKGHPYLKALADLTLGGLHLRGLRLEQKQRGNLTLGFPGRKIQGHWQVVYEPEDSKVEQRLLKSLETHYYEQEKAA